MRKHSGPRCAALCIMFALIGGARANAVDVFMHDQVGGIFQQGSSFVFTATIDDLGDHLYYVWFHFTDDNSDIVFGYVRGDNEDTIDVHATHTFGQIGTGFQAWVYVQEVITGAEAWDSMGFSVVNLSLTSTTAKAAPDGATPSTRTTIGIGEAVTVAAQMDPVFDPVEPFTWTVTGGGNLTAPPNKGLTTSQIVLNAPCKQCTPTVSVQLGHASASRQFTVIPPNTITAGGPVTDDWPSAKNPTVQVGNDWMGCSSTGWTTLGPLSVCFSGAGNHFREDKMGGDSQNGGMHWMWPDGSPLNCTFPGDDRYVTYWVQDDNRQQDKWRAPYKNPTHPPAQLNGQDFEPQAPNWTIAEDWGDDDGNWYQFTTILHEFQYHQTPTPGNARAGAGGTFGGWQGPFRNPAP